MRLVVGLFLGVLACRAGAGPAAPAAASAPPAAPTIYLANVAPFAYEDDGRRAGVVNDLLEAMASRAGLSAHLVALPFYRMVNEMATHPDTPGAVWRTADTGRAYDWQLKLFDDRVVAYARADSQADLSSVDALRRLRVGVLLGGVPDVMARSWGLAHIEATNDPGNIARKLDLGRIDAWLAVRSVAAFGQMRIGARLEQLRRGALEVPVAMYLACARRCDPVQGERWAAALAALQRDGTYARILRRYYFTPLSAAPVPQKH